MRVRRRAPNIPAFDTDSDGECGESMKARNVGPLDIAENSEKGEATQKIKVKVEDDWERERDSIKEILEKPPQVEEHRHVKREESEEARVTETTLHHQTSALEINERATELMLTAIEPERCTSKNIDIASTTRGRRPYRRLKQSTLMDIDKVDKLKCANLILRLCSKANLDPMCLLRRYLRSLKNLAKVTPIQAEKSTASVTCKLESFAKFCSSRKRSRANDYDHDFDQLLACIAFAIESRRVQRKLRESGTKAKAESIVKDIVRQNDARYSLRVGEHLLKLCWAISPRNLFGLIVISAMSLSKSDIWSMSKGTRGAFIMLFTGYWTPTESEMPLPVCAAVNAVVRTIIPAAELMLIMNLKKEKAAMRSLTNVSNFIYRCGEEEKFGFRFCNAFIVMPQQYLVSDYFITCRKDDSLTSLIKSSLVIKHPAPISVYQTSSILRDTHIDDLCILQEKFFHSPIVQTQTPIPPVIHDLYPNDYFIVTPFAFATFEEHGKFELLLSCLKNAFWILHGEQDFDHDSTQYSVLSAEYMDAYKNADEDRELNKIVDVHRWEPEEEDFIDRQQVSQEL